ncbi:hypothetical protein DPMN_168975 [Dreissena polymorpha]|uniref:Uncharacterized protein n=1 Tax=Dreissena polymorpha TaxID=45954 RepID=A0A9D4F4E7_DREPO|nr:hypothetical protein DPMN_168975 [Dreissena polymorpha]
MGTACETRPEPRRLEEAGWRPITQMGPQAKMTLVKSAFASCNNKFQILRQSAVS